MRCLPKTIGHNLVSFVLSSRSGKKREKITQSENEDDMIWRDALMVAIQRPKWTHKLNKKMNLRTVIQKFLGMPKILPPHTKLLLDPAKLQMWSNDGSRCPHEWPNVFTEPNLNIFFMCPLVSISGQFDACIKKVRGFVIMLN